MKTKARSKKKRATWDYPPVIVSDGTALLFAAVPGVCCDWAPGQGDLCTVCAGFRETLQISIEECNRVTAASLSRLLHEEAAT